jgi:hypothetical protein
MKGAAKDPVLDQDHRPMVNKHGDDGDPFQPVAV